MFTRIFKKRHSGKDEAPMQPVLPATMPDDVVFDESLASLDSALRGLAGIEVAQAAKERGWANVRRELERRPVRPVVHTPSKGVPGRPLLSGSAVRTATDGHSRGWRVAVGSLAAVAAVAIAVFASYGAGVFNTATGTSLNVAGSSSSTLPPTSVAVSDTTAVTTGPSTVTTQNSTTPGTDVTTTATTVQTGTTNGTQGTTSSSKGPSVTNNAPTTQPQQGTTTTNEQQMADRQLETSAVGAAEALGRAVIQRMDTGVLPDVRSLVDPSAQSALTWMISSLDHPSDGFSVDQSATKIMDDNTVRVTLQFIDGDQTPRFFITVRVTPDSAVVIDISRGL
jgi:hypothetical protein